ncbi:hypothetical protein DM02DRAFT_626331 [Periconia macrospinosa]|uniref:Uncharacterized protein n=1 Tax=Periconia macrospinosa TaxID=97972 RepID=A0A2V1DY43_9PLEO|nr:hypothetical protein DM02DRAFT_626331 [Periconia macrospinosa]
MDDLTFAVYEIIPTRKGGGAVGKLQDTRSPGTWESSDIVVFPSGSKLARYAGLGKGHSGFFENAGKWNEKIVYAMAKMALFRSRDRRKDDQMQIVVSETRKGHGPECGLLAVLA